LEKRYILKACSFEKSRTEEKRMGHNFREHPVCMRVGLITFSYGGGQGIQIQEDVNRISRIRKPRACQTEDPIIKRRKKRKRNWREKG
jgi:hypothetical protein